MSNEEEKRERRVLDLDKISGEGKTLKDITLNEIIDLTESGEEIPDELKDELKKLMQALDKTVSEVGSILLRPIVDAIEDTSARILDSFRDSLEIPQIRILEEIRDIATVPDEEGWKLVAAYHRDVPDIQLALLETFRAGNRRAVILAAIGWALAIIMPLLVWYLSR